MQAKALRILTYRRQSAIHEKTAGPKRDRPPDISDLSAGLRCPGPK
ncbi:MAG: hypothetical protein ACI87O_002709, partial [Planctomycetota bacterium]